MNLGQWGNFDTKLIGVFPLHDNRYANLVDVSGIGVPADSCCKFHWHENPDLILYVRLNSIKGKQDTVICATTDGSELYLVVKNMSMSTDNGKFEQTNLNNWWALKFTSMGDVQKAQFTFNIEHFGGMQSPASHSFVLGISGGKLKLAWSVGSQLYLCTIEGIETTDTWETVCGRGAPYGMAGKDLRRRHQQHGRQVSRSHFSVSSHLWCFCSAFMYSKDTEGKSITMEKSMKISKFDK